MLFAEKLSVADSAPEVSQNSHENDAHRFSNIS
jgi:hypothetical protein